MIQRASAKDEKTDEWGAVVCNAQMSIGIKEPTKEIKTNEPIILTIRVKGIATNETPYFVLYSRASDFSWVVTSPSGKATFFEESAPQEALATMTVSLNENPNWKAKFDLSSLYSFNEVGTYKVTAKKEILLSGGIKKCEIVSNPLDVVISK
jgi:hypothetical protein